MTRFVVRPTGPYESDGYSVVDTNREDERGKQIGRGLRKNEAIDLSVLLNGLDANGDERIREVLGFCADAYDDYLPAEEKRANRAAHEKSDAIASTHRAALLNLLSFAEEVVRMEIPDKALLQTARTFVLPRAREALGE